MAELPHDPVAGLVDIPLPIAVSLWPQTWPSRIAIVLGVIGMVFAAGWLARHWYRNRYRRAALAELARIEATADATSPAELSTALASLVRRTALAVFPRDRVAPLAGTDWLSFLDRTAGTSDFSNGSGRSLEIAAYRPQRENSRDLIAAVRQWIVRHHA